jgi:hypothetical protein
LVNKTFRSEFYIIIVLLRIYTVVILDYDTVCLNWIQMTLEDHYNFVHFEQLQCKLDDNIN